MAHLMKRVSIVLLLHCVVVHAGTIKDGFPCSKHTDCVTGLHCVGKIGNERCKRPMLVGEYCGDPTWVCAKDLDCQKIDGKDTCVKVLGDGGYKCKEKGYVCDSGLHCVGKAGYERCKKPMGYGEYCGDPTWVCSEGLTCEGVRKEAVCVNTLPEGGPCGGKFDRCVKGTICENKKCVKESEPKPSESITPKASKKPKTKWPSSKPTETPKQKPKASPSPVNSPKATPKKNKKKKPKRCNPENSRCEPGYFCVGRKGYEVCKKPMKEGESCRDPTWVCEKSLQCVGQGKNAVCRKPASKKKTLSGRCGKRKKPCPKDTFCVELKGRTVCKRHRKEGERCPDSTWICEDGLYCVGKGTHAICSKTVGLGQACGRGSKCPSGMHCRRYRQDVPRCVKMLKDGAACGVKRFTFCTRGTYCRGKAGKKTCTGKHKPVPKKLSKNNCLCCKCNN